MASSTVRSLNTTHWGVGTSLSRNSLAPVAFNDLCSQLSDPSTAEESLARLVVQGTLYDHKRLPRPAADGVRLADALDTVTPKRGAWPYFVACSLRNEDLPPTQGFVDNMKNKVIKAADKDAWAAAEPLELSFMREYTEQSPETKPYNLAKPAKRDRYLIELLGETTAKTVLGSANGAAKGPEAPKLDIPLPGTGTSRLLGRRTGTAQTSSFPAFKGRGLTKLGSRGRSPKSPNGKSARAAMAAIRAMQQSKKISVVDSAELPQPDDTLQVRTNRQTERMRLKEEARQKKEAAQKEREAKKEEERKKMIERKRLVTEEFRYSQAQSEPTRYISDDDDNGPLSDDNNDSDYSPGAFTKRTSAERLSLPPSKRARVPRRTDKVATPTSARTGEDAYRARAKFTNNRSVQINEMERSLRGPNYSDNIHNVPMSMSLTSSPTTIPTRSPVPRAVDPVLTSLEPNRISDLKWEELAPEFRRAVGEQYRYRLSEQTQADLYKFTTRAHDMNDIFEGNEERKEYVLHEADDYTIVIRCVKSEGNWQRVRYAES